MGESGFGGRYPGGPRRGADGAIGKSRDPHAPPAIASVGEMEERAFATAARRAKERRARRVRIGLLVVLVAGGAIGLWMGLEANATPEEIVDEMNRANQPSPISSEEMLRRELIRLQNQPQTPAAPRPGAAPSTTAGTRP